MAVAITVSAQDSDKQYRPTGGESNLEFQFTPFGTSPIGISGIRYRKFTSQYSAFRLNAHLSFSNATTITQQADPDNDIPELKDTDQVFGINLRPGFEKHLSGTERLSPYYGLEFDVAWQRTVAKEEREDFGTGDIIIDKTIDQFGFFRLGLNAVAGFDFYVAERLYMGAELGFGFSWQKESKIKFKSSEDGFVEPDPIKRGGEFELGPNIVSAIRVGYIF